MNVTKTHRGVIIIDEVQKQNINYICINNFLNHCTICRLEFFFCIVCVVQYLQSGSSVMSDSY